jgi:hypothetical protein
LICFNIEDEKYIPQKVHETKAAFYHLKQGKDSDQAHQIKFMNTVQVIEQCGASLEEDPMTRAMVCKNLGYSIRTTTNTEVAEITKTVRDYTLGQVDGEAAQQLLDGSQLANENEEYYADLFLCEEQKHTSVSFQLKDGINGGRIPKDWILLDSQLTTDAYSNEVRGSLTIHTQAGKAVTKLRGTVPGYGEVWFCPDGIANILSLARVAKSRLVTFDSTNGNHIAVTKADGKKRIFRQSEHGLYYYDMRSA